MGQVKLYLVRDGVTLKMIGRVLKEFAGDPKLHKAFCQSCVRGLDADSPHAEAIRELIEARAWKWTLVEKSP